MKFAYILDSSSNYKNNNKDVYIIPFRAYEPSGKQVNVYDTRLLNNLIDSKKDGTKSFIEPTPGMYRDLYLNLKKRGYEHIIVIPQSKEKSISYKNASYATNITNMDVSVIDASELNVSPIEILDHILTDSKTSETIQSVTFDFNTFLNYLVNSFNTVRLAR